MTSTTLTVRADRASVVVAAVARAPGTPEGTVVFAYGDTTSDPVRLVHGQATLDRAVPGDTEVSVVYRGDADFAGSSGSTLRRNPTIEADVTASREVPGRVVPPGGDGLLHLHGRQRPAERRLPLPRHARHGRAVARGSPGR